MKAQAPKTEVKPRPLSRYAAHAGETETWIDVAAPSCTEAEKLHAVYSAAPELLRALEKSSETLEWVKQWLIDLEQDSQTVTRRIVAEIDKALTDRAAIAKALGK